MNELGWWMMDQMERSQSLNREALSKIIESAFQNTGHHPKGAA